MMSNDEPGGTMRSHGQFLNFVRTYAGHGLSWIPPGPLLIAALSEYQCVGARVPTHCTVFLSTGQLSGFPRMATLGA